MNQRPLPVPLRRYFGLDLGQVRDFTALSIIEKQGDTPEAELHVRHLQRWPLGTSYPDIVADVIEILNNPAFARGERPTLALDATGVGVGITDLFRKEYKDQKLKVSQFFPVMITGGDSLTMSGGYWRVPKRDLVGIAQSALQTGRLKVAQSLPEAATLQQELLNFEVKININATDQYGAWREGQHDDLVLAVALSLWAALRPDPCSTLRSTSYQTAW